MNDKNTMKALVLRKHGGLEELAVVNDYPVPKAIDGHVVIRVRASSFNYHDVFTVRGMPGIKVPLPVIIGLDMAGEITELGAGVEWLEGGRPRVGESAEQEERIDGRNARRRHGGILPGRGGPAGRYAAGRDLRGRGITAGRLRYRAPHADHARYCEKRERVLILGASGGVGTGCVILAKHLGAEVIACTSSPEKMQKLKELGADEVINVKDVDFSKWAVEKYGKPQRRNYDGGVDVVVNFTGGDTWHPSLRCLKRGGKLLVCGATAGYDPKEDLRYVWSFELKIIGSNSFYDDDLQGLMKLIAEGKMKPVIDKVLPLEQAAEGLRLIQDREVIGKVVVAPVTTALLSSSAKRMI